MKVPLGVQFEPGQPSAIVNSGNLSVESGQNMTLTGGTVVSTGELSAPDGQVALAAVPSQSMININTSTGLVNIVTPYLFGNPAMLPRYLAILHLNLRVK
ncbi:MAG: hypothetical protein AAF915_02735 [Cyanobacteria bacterium P01_D01_bin.50]